MVLQKGVVLQTIVMGISRLACVLTLIDAGAAYGAQAPATQSPGDGVAVSTTAKCSIIDANVRKPGAVASLYAACGQGSLRLGEASTFVVSTNVRLGAALVVRETAAGTAVDLVIASPDGSATTEAVAGELRQMLAEAGLGRPQRLSIDAASFAVDGKISAAPIAASVPGKAASGAAAADGIAAVSLDLSSRSVLVRAAGVTGEAVPGGG